MASCNLRCILLTALLFFGVIAIVCAKPVETGWRCGAGQSQTQPAKLTPLPETMTPETLRSWDVFAVNAIARGIRGEAALADVSPLFETLLTQGLFAGAYAEIPETMSDLTDLSLRSAGFLDAARRFDHYWNTGLLREILSDEKLVAALRSDTTSQADAGAVEFVTRHLKEPSQISALLPLVLELRNCLSVVDDLSAVAREFEAGKPGLATIQLLAVTYLWDVRLYLQTVMNDELLISALHQSDEKLLADFRSNGSANLLRWFLFGGYEAQAKAALWDAFEAPRFIALYQDNTWVGHAAALANELVLGTVLSVTAEPVAVVGIMGETAPYVVSVRPAKGASYATPALVWPRTAQQTYEGFRCLQETSVEFTPAPVTGEPASSGLRFVLAYNKPGEYRLSFQYKLYGIELSTVELKPIVLLHNQSGSDAMAVNPEPVERPLQLEKLPANYRFTMQSDHQAIRKITLLSDGEHAFEYIIRWEVQHHGTQPATGVSF